jgi:hypothetical protein
MAELTEKSGVHLTGADSGWPVASSGENQPHKDGTGADPFVKASEVADNVIEVSERQSVAVKGTSGTYTLTYSGQTTAAIDFDETPENVQAALVALSNLAPGDVVVSGGVGNAAGDSPYYLTFGGTLADTDVAEVTATDVDLAGTGHGVTIATVSPGS